MGRNDDDKAHGEFLGGWMIIIGVICLLTSIIIFIVDAVKCDKSKVYQENEYNPCKTGKTYGKTWQTFVAGIALCVLGVVFHG
jgi:uncharacterized membrane protein